MYYNSNELFSRQSQINFVMGERGNGKSFDCKKRMITNFLKKGEQSVYIRRRKTDIEEVKDLFFDDIIEFFPGVEFKIDGMQGYINGEVAIIFVPLSTSMKKKSSPFPKVTLIVFDEYIEPSFKYPNYLKNDMFFLFELINTIVRKRDNWKLLLVGNAISFVNPFFTMFNIEIKEPNKRFHNFLKDSDDGHFLITVELTDTPEFREEYAKTKFAKIIKNTSYGDYSMSAKGYEDNTDFICDRKPGQYFYVCTIISENQTIGVWLHGEGHFYIDNIIDKTTQFNFALLSDDLKEGFTLIKSNIKSWRVKKLKESYLNGEVYYKNQEVKKFFMNNVSKYI